MKNHHYLHLQCASWPKVTLRYVRVKMIVMMSLTLMSLLTSLMSIHFVIKREKGKVKVLESTRAKLELAHSDLLGKYNDLLKKHNESLVLAKQVEESHKSLNKSIGSWLTNIKNLNLPMKQLTQVFRTLLIKLLRRLMLLLHVMTYSLMQMLLMLCPSLYLLGKRN